MDSSSNLLSRYFEYVKTALEYSDYRQKPHRVHPVRFLYPKATCSERNPSLFLRGISQVSITFFKNLSPDLVGRQGTLVLPNEKPKITFN
jgi:hypothetical protein